MVVLCAFLSVYVKKCGKVVESGINLSKFVLDNHYVYDLFHK